MVARGQLAWQLEALPVLVPAGAMTKKMPEMRVKSCPYSLTTQSAAAKSETALLGRAQAEMLLSCRVGEQDL